MQRQITQGLLLNLQFPNPPHVTVKTRSHVRTLQQLGRQTELLAQPGMFLQTVLLVIAEEAKISTKRKIFHSNLLFSGVESTSWFDFSKKFGVVLVGFFFQRDFSDALLVVVVVENQRHILEIDKIELVYAGFAKLTCFLMIVVTPYSWLFQNSSNSWSYPMTLGS